MNTGCRPSDMIYIFHLLNLSKLIQSHILTFPVRLCAPLDQPDGVLGELAQGVHELHDLVHDDYGAGLKNGEGKSDV